MSERWFEKLVFRLDGAFSGSLLVGDTLEIVEIKENAATMEITLQVKPRAPSAIPEKPPDIGVHAVEQVGTRERLG